MILCSHHDVISVFPAATSWSWTFLHNKMLFFSLPYQVEHFPWNKMYLPIAVFQTVTSLQSQWKLAFDFSSCLRFQDHLLIIHSFALLYNYSRLRRILISSRIIANISNYPLLFLLISSLQFEFQFRLHVFCQISW